jgi:uncharacterized membrane protein
MATSSAIAIRSPKIGFKHVLFFALGLTFLFALWHDERFIVDRSYRPEEREYFLPVLWLVIPHGLAGLTAFLIGPFQFSSRFRQRHLRLHRVVGRFYLGGIAIAAPAGMYLAHIHSSVGIRFYIFALAPAWLLTAVIAFVCVRNGNIQMHRQWMVRSYALTSVFATNKVFYAIPAVARSGTLHLGVAWSVLVATLVLTEVGLAWPAIFANKRA